MLKVERATVLFAMMGMLGCGGGAPGGDAGTDAPPAIDAAPIPLVDVDVSITSSVSSFDGHLRVAAFRMNPPSMPPLASSVLDAPTFPTQTTLRDLEPGTIYVLGVLDFDPPSPTLPGPEDSVTASEAITITGDETAPVPVSLDIPAPPAP